jgi:hypothetical protein
MDMLRHISFENKYLRHGSFWFAWVIGFTFIKSFGSGLETYAGWLVYYLVTLPLFVTHTYLLVYWAAKKFLSGAKIILFIILFIVLMFVFSYAEMFITHTFLSLSFPSVFTGNLDYRDPLNVLISGIGNLYIILVFAAAKMVRSWYLSNKKSEQLVQDRLFRERADANAGIQPGMLLFSVGSIERLAGERPADVAAAIAMLSELLNAAMQAHKSSMLRLDEEMKNVRSLLKLYALLMLKATPLLKIDQCSSAISSLPAFMVFSPLEIVIRKFHWMLDDSIEVCLRREDLVSISWKRKGRQSKLPDPGEIMRELDMLFPGRYRVRIGSESEIVTMWINENPDWRVESHTLTTRGGLSVG